jgi:enamine deaminase RidA (YjgF/YER057c/UK114 family)
VNRRLISSGSTFEREIGYSRAVVDGEWVFVSGTTGYDYQAMTISDNLLEQTEQCLRNIKSALEQAGASFADVVRVTYILPRSDDFPACWPVLRKYFGDVRPAATMISAGLADPRMRIEIEVTARRRAAAVV